MQIYANKSIRIDETLSTSLRSSIKIFGNVAYGSLSWGDRKDIKKLLEEQVNWKEAFATINFVKLEENKEQKHNDLGWIIMDGTFELHKESKYFAIRCNCCLSTEKWLQLKNDLLAKIDSNYSFEFNINQINSAKLKETDETIESNIELYMESYSIVKIKNITL
jgi:hypothetical protein